METWQVAFWVFIGFGLGASFWRWWSLRRRRRRRNVVEMYTPRYEPPDTDTVESLVNDKVKTVNVAIPGLDQDGNEVGEVVDVPVEESADAEQVYREQVSGYNDMIGRSLRR
jgi:hypothetical protein